MQSIVMLQPERRRQAGMQFYCCFRKLVMWDYEMESVVHTIHPWQLLNCKIVPQIKHVHFLPYWVICNRCALPPGLLILLSSQLHSWISCIFNADENVTAAALKQKSALKSAILWHATQKQSRTTPLLCFHHLEDGFQAFFLARNLQHWFPCRWMENLFWRTRSQLPFCGPQLLVFIWLCRYVVWMFCRQTSTQESRTVTC